MPHKGFRHTWAIKGRGGAGRILALALLALLFVLVGACGGDDSAEAAAAADSAAEAEAAMMEESSDDMAMRDSSAAAAEAAMMEESSDDMAMRDSSASADGTTDTALALSTATSPADYGRDVIYRAAIAVEAPDVAAATREAVAIIQGLGGIVFGQQTFTKPQPRSEITFKVLPEDFALALERLAGVGQLVDQQISADDVTDRIVNFQSRIITSEASVLRLRKFLEEATNIDNVAFLERELLNRETDLETLRGQLRTLQDQVSLATITLTINQLPEPPIVVPDTGIFVAAWVSSADDDPCLGFQDITVEPDATVDFCLEVENLGEVALTDVRFRSEALRLRSGTPSPNMNSFLPVQGNFDRIEPGHLLFATLSEPVVNGRLAGRFAREGLDILFHVTATPVDSDGAVLEDVITSSRVFVYVYEDDSLPGFSAAVRAGTDTLVSIANRLAVVFGVLVPFLPFIILVAAIVWWIRRRARRRIPSLPRRRAVEESRPSRPVEDEV